MLAPGSNIYIYANLECCKMFIFENGASIAGSQHCWILKTSFFFGKIKRTTSVCQNILSVNFERVSQKEFNQKKCSLVLLFFDQHFNDPKKH